MLEQPTGRHFLIGALEHPYGRGINLQIDTGHIDDLYAKVLAAKAAIYLPMEEKAYRRNDTDLVVRQFIVQDPDGYLLRFSQRIGAHKTE